MRSLVACALVAACSGSRTVDIRPSLRFADRTSAEIQRLIAAARGAEIYAATYTLATSPGDSCPVVSIAGQTTTFQGGCTTQAGAMFDGTASLARDSADRAQFDAWTLTEPSGSTTYSGYVEWRNTPLLGAESDLTADIDGVAVRSDLTYGCHALPGCDNECTMECTPDGSGIELVGVGGALVSGTWRYNVMGNIHLVDTSITLRGADTLTTTPTGWQITQ
jgi:hypothetical protein